MKKIFNRYTSICMAGLILAVAMIIWRGDSKETVAVASPPVEAVALCTSITKQSERWTVITATIASLEAEKKTIELSARGKDQQLCADYQFTCSRTGSGELIAAPDCQRSF